MNGVDRKDRDTADWTVSLKTNRYYLRIFFWLFDAVIHCCYVCACQLPQFREQEYKKGGRGDFQNDLAMALTEEALTMDWKGELDQKSGSPEWARNNLHPCGCGRCFYCKHGHTAGIQSRRTVRTLPPKLVQCRGGDRVSLYEGSRRGRCAQCAVNLKKEHPDETAEWRKAKCGQSRFGCKECTVPICKSCWPTYDHMLGNPTIPPDEV